MMEVESKQRGQELAGALVLADRVRGNSNDATRWWTRFLVLLTSIHHHHRARCTTYLTYYVYRTAYGFIRRRLTAVRMSQTCQQTCSCDQLSLSWLEVKKQLATPSSRARESVCFEEPNALTPLLLRV